MRRLVLLLAATAVIAACQDIAGIIEVKVPTCPVKRPTDTTASVPLGCFYDSTGTYTGGR